ncbi:MAG: SUMF1/EgtB/PvdO family nonheme iron enzyme [Thermoguttaceae bacterium]|nr:SUMF1/EgtB/PvdO family nonheme iron enzyme [Thermoguttaceae bacterium]
MAKKREKTPKQASVALENCDGPWDSNPAPGTRKTLEIAGVEWAFRYCPPGTFAMGSPVKERWRRSDETLHNVTLTEGFWLAETPTTQAQYVALTGTNPSWFSLDGGGRTGRGEAHSPVKVWFKSASESAEHPVENVSWDDAQEAIRNLDDYGVLPSDFEFRLPWEAEWERACRAGSTGPYDGDEKKPKAFAWYEDNSFRSPWNFWKTAPVGKKSPNAWGLFDMRGNVYEWCGDRYGEYSEGPATDPTGASEGFRRVLRGGSFQCCDDRLRSAFRFCLGPNNRSVYFGFRVAVGRRQNDKK